MMDKKRNRHKVGFKREESMKKSIKNMLLFLMVL